MPEPDPLNSAPSNSDPSNLRRQARRTVLIGVAVVVLFASLTASPLLLGRGTINRFIVAVGVMGVLAGGSFVLHGSWDWLRAGKR